MLQVQAEGGYPLWQSDLDNLIDVIFRASSIPN